MLKFQKIMSISLTALLFASATIITSCATRYEHDPMSLAKSSAITFKVKENLFRDRYINSSHISVSTYRDTVTLSGFVRSEAEEDRVIDIARSVKGVKYVVDNLVVK